jgi:acyl-CoA reductase-like NAD-dependent aldehyde dehydrogenase
MHRFADGLTARAGVTTTLVSRENGMRITLSTTVNGAAPVDLLRMYADLVTEHPLEEVRPSASGSTFVWRTPVGVVGAITPWNYPQILAMSKLAPALAAGCTVVLKPSPETALDSYLLGDAAVEAGLPPGVLNIVLADREVGASLVSHPGVDKIAFTGSTAAGGIIGAECGRLIRRCTLELGGKSAANFLDDGDLDTFVKELIPTSSPNNSQTCTTQSRILAPRSRYNIALQRGDPRHRERGRRTSSSAPAGPGHHPRPHGQPDPPQPRPRPHRHRQPQRRPPDHPAAAGPPTRTGAGSSGTHRHDRRGLLPDRPRHPVRRREGQRHRTGVRPRRTGQLPQYQSVYASAAQLNH